MRAGVPSGASEVEYTPLPTAAQVELSVSHLPYLPFISQYNNNNNNFTILQGIWGQHRIPQGVACVCGAMHAQLISSPFSTVAYGTPMMLFFIFCHRRREIIKCVSSAATSKGLLAHARALQVASSFSREKLS